MTSAMCMSPTTRFITSIGQGEPAMMPVRRLEVELGKARVVQLGDEHGGHAVQAGAALVLHRLQHGQGVEAIVRVDDGGAVREAGQVAQHHAKQWYNGTGMHRRSAGVRRMASPMKKPLFRMLRCVSVAPFGNPVVPLVNWILMGSWLSGGGNGGQARIVGATALDELRETQHTTRPVSLAGFVDPDHAAQLRQARGLQGTRLRTGQFRREFAQHAQVVAGLEARHAHQRLAAHLVQRVFDLGHAVGRVDIHQNQADLGRGQFISTHCVVVRPDADAVARHQAQVQQRAASWLLAVCSSR